MFKIFLSYWWQYLLVILCSYFIGAINFSIVFSHLFKKTDVRNYGSGNPGTTNMFRVFGLRMGALTFLFDALKGVLCCVLTKYVIFASLGVDVSNTAGYLAGLFAVVGHVFPAIHKFRGGKGVATSLGVMFSMQPILMLCLIVPICLIILITDRMSVMSLVYSLFMIVWAWAVLLNKIGAFCCLAITLMYALIIFAHRHNIVRLLRGQELPTGVRKALRGKSDKIVK